MSEHLSQRLMTLSKQLMALASEYENMKFTAAEEAMTWPLAIIKDEWGDFDLWCEKEDCPLDGHNSKIDVRFEHFTMAELLGEVVDHIERAKERADDLRSMQE